MTPQQETLLNQVLNEMVALREENSALRKEVSTINKALAYKTTAVKKQETAQDLERLVISQIILKGKQNRKN